MKLKTDFCKAVKCRHFIWKDGLGYKIDKNGILQCRFNNEWWFCEFTFPAVSFAGRLSPCTEFEIAVLRSKYNLRKRVKV